MNTATPRKLSLLAFAIACEALENSITGNFELAQKLAGEGKVEEAQRALAAAEATSDKLEALVEEQLAAAGEKRPSTAKVDAALAA